MSSSEISALEISYKKLCDSISHVAQYLPPIGPVIVNLGTLTDDEIASQAEKLGFRKNIHSLESIRQILIKFYNFYFRGTVAEEIKVSQVVYEAAALSYVGGKFLFEETADTPFYKYHACDDSIVFQDDTIIRAEPKVPQTITDSRSKEAYESLLMKFDRNNVSKFIVTVRNLIKSFPMSGELSPDHKKLLSLTGYLGLTMCRSVIKTAIQMTNAFSKVQFKKNLSSVAKWPASNGYVPPCEECIRVITIDLRRGSVGSSQFFLLATNKFVQLQKEGAYTDPALEYMSSSLMTPTAKNGMGILSMLDSVCKQLNKPVIEIVRLTNFRETEASWETILNFQREFLAEENVQYGFNWARIINDGYFLNFAPKENVHLAGIFLGILEQDSDSDITSAHWVRKLGRRLDNSRAIGAAVYRKCTSEMR